MILIDVVHDIDNLMMVIHDVNDGCDNLLKREEKFGRIKMSFYHLCFAQLQSFRSWSSSQS